MKDNAHLYWPSTIEYPLKPWHPPLKGRPGRRRGLRAAVASGERLGGGCLLYRLVGSERRSENKELSVWR